MTDLVGLALAAAVAVWQLRVGRAAQPRRA
jgi:hypothetical protein